MPTTFDDLPNPYAITPEPQGFNPADFLTQLGIALSIMGARNPETATRLFLGAQENQRRRQAQQMLQHKYGQEQALALQDRLGMMGMTEAIKQAMMLRGGDGTPGETDGLRPPEQTGFGDPQAFQQAQRQLDPAMLQQLISISPSVAKQFQDPQTQTYWQSIGLVPPTHQTLIGRQNADSSDQRAAISALNAEINRQRADIYKDRLAFDKQKESLETEWSKIKADAERARTASLGARTDRTSQLTPLDVKLREEDLFKKQTLAPYIQPQAEADLAGTKARTAKTKTAATGKGGKPSEKQNDVDAMALEMRKVGQEQASAMVKQATILTPQLYPLYLRAYQKAWGQGQPQSAPATTPAQRFKFDLQGNPIK